MSEFLSCKISTNGTLNCDNDPSFNYFFQVPHDVKVITSCSVHICDLDNCLRLSNAPGIPVWNRGALWRRLMHGNILIKIPVAFLREGRLIRISLITRAQE